jgi:thiol-disulfide isomerase/thioredoxin
MRSGLVSGAARVDTDDVGPAWTAQLRAGAFGYHQVGRRSGRRRRERGQPLIGTVVIAAAVLLASCGTSPATRAHSAASGPRAATGRVVLTTIDGAAVRVPGNRPSVLVFLSMTCADCADAARTLAQVEAATKATARAAHLAAAKARFLGVDMDRGASGQAVTDFLHSVGAAGLPTVLDQKAVLSGAYQVTALSTVLVIDQAGRVTFRAINPSPAKILAAVDAVS